MTDQSKITKQGSWRIQVMDEVDSTNRWLADAYAAGHAIAGDVVRAVHQTSGKGRHGNQWQSSDRALYLSMVIRDEESFGTRWALVIGLAVREAIITAMPKLADHLRLKWPNDVMLGEAKLGGILIERAGEGKTWDLIIGVGVNVNQPDNVPGAAALAANDLTAEVLAREILSQIDRLRSAFHRGGAMALRQAWLQHAWHRGGHVSCHVDGKRLHGTFDDLDLDGAMILSLPDGTERKITGGEVHFADLEPIGLETA